jgi:hypothetical protein
MRQLTLAKRRSGSLSTVSAARTSRFTSASSRKRTCGWARQAFGNYIDATRSVLRERGGLWFFDESYVISRRRG